jgi:cell division protein FtsQ
VRRRPKLNEDLVQAPKNRRRTPKPTEAQEPLETSGAQTEVAQGKWARRREALKARLGWLITGLRWLGRLLFVAACVAGLWATGSLLRKHALTSPYFAVDELSLSGNERLAPEALLSASGLGEGRNIFEVSPAEAQRRLEALPWVKSARVERRLPRSLSVNVVEHHAVALLSLSKLYLVDREGSVFSELGSEDPIDLPVITGVDEDRFRRDRHYRIDALTLAASILEDVRAAGLYRRLPVQEMHLQDDGGLSLVMGEDALLVARGTGPYGPKLRRLRRVLDGLARRHQQAVRVFLDNERRPNRVVVRLAAASTGS